jgi:hypothetical protein
MTSGLSLTTLAMGSFASKALRKAWFEGHKNEKNVS